MASVKIKKIKWGNRDTSSGLLLPGSNSVGGWDVDIAIKNQSAKVVKYVTIQLKALNTVGDQIFDKEHGNNLNLQITGPLEPGKSASVSWDTIFYAFDLAKFEAESIEITYMDGTTETTSGSEMEAEMNVSKQEDKAKKKKTVIIVVIVIAVLAVLSGIMSAAGM